MSGIQRYSSRRESLEKVFLAEKLKGAKSYKRIAGYFRSSIFELIGEEIETIETVQIVCNSDLDPADIQVSRLARETALKERWNAEAPAEMEALLHKAQYQKLFDFLNSGRVEVRVVPKDVVFVHGKAGVIEAADGTRTAFLGSANETLSAYVRNYELVWEDSSEEGIRWVEEEFDALWADAIPLPDAIIEEIGRVAHREEVTVIDVRPEELAGAALAESPIYRGGEQLQPWQRAFVMMFLQHKETYGRARLLLADEVGVGKTLSLAASALVSVLQDDGPVLILCPSTLTLQWLVELKDKLGIPSAVWHSSRKEWLDSNGHVIKTRGAEDILRCPYKIAIVSTGLIFQGTAERDHLLSRRYGTVILDEAHKARRKGGLGGQNEPNNLLKFMLEIGKRTENLLLGTATPIQTEVYELWDLMKILSSGADFVLGRQTLATWHDWNKALPRVVGDESPMSERDSWEWMRSPLPPANENPLFADIRLQLGIAEKAFFTDRGFASLSYLEQQTVAQSLEPQFYKSHNPILRHTVLRRRQTLEEMGLLDRIAVDVHPMQEKVYSGMNFHGLGLMTNLPFDLAYQAADNFTTELKKRTNAAGFMKSMLLQRICSSFASGLSTANKMLGRQDIDEEDEEAVRIADLMSGLTHAEIKYLEEIIRELSRPEARDPKLDAVQYFLTQYKTEGKTWLEHGCIIFSQYYDTALWFASELAKKFPNEPIAVYAGVGKSRLFHAGDSGSVEREDIKSAVKRREIRLLVATDAACEGLNLQTLGTLINVDLPWNPSRLEQRLGRIKRFGQARTSVDMLNLVYHDTRDETVYQALSKRLKAQFDIFGGLPDTIEDEWIENVELLGEYMDTYIHARQKARDSFELKYKDTVNPDANRWELCSRVLARKDVVAKLSEAW